MKTRLLWTGLLGVALAGPVCAAPVMEVKVNDAAFVRQGQPVPVPLNKDYFGPGVDGTAAWDGGGHWAGVQNIRDEVRFTLKDLPAGDYVLGLQVRNDTYFGASEFYTTRVLYYLNNTRWLPSGNTEPVRPAGVAAPFYVSELQFGPLPLKPGDVFRVLAHGGCTISLGPLRVYRAGAAPAAVALTTAQPPQRDLVSLWLYADWTGTQTNGDTLAQGYRLYNPGTLPITIDLAVEARDWLMTDLYTRREPLTLAPGQMLTNTFTFKPGDTGRARLELSATQPGCTPVRICKFWSSDVAEGPRPTLGLQGEWEMAWVPGAEPGAAPPADAAWVKTNLPAFMAATNFHCAWFRRTFDAPASLRGDRIFLKSDAMPSEVWVYLNGQPVGHELHASQVFELDVTAGFRPGQKNELLIAVRGWLAYSPVNQERVRRGEPAIPRDNMLDITDYHEMIGFGPIGPVRLEARPAVAVDDVFVVTSVREKKLTLRYRLANAGAQAAEVTLAPRVLDGGQAAKEFPAQKVSVPAGSNLTLTVEQPWADPHLWSPDDPHLYVLETAVTPAAGTPDRHRQRFGFRELWIEGYSFLLNGTRVKIRSNYGVGAPGRGPANAFWDPARRYEAVWDWQRFSMDEVRVQLGRAHLGSRSEEAFEIADETGMLIQMEGEVHQLAFTWDERFWKAMVAHEVRLVDMYKNHPSIVIWSGGNENMWGWVYQGEKARDLANHWQVEVAKAIHGFDLMRRPVNWEADSDLFGQGDYYALHYPREVGTFPDVPVSAWWGPLDGKTVIKYTQGDITLGKKPLQCGESFWMRGSMAMPFGPTLVLGDAAYLGGFYQWKGWLESSTFIANGFRDVEFAHIDTLIPLTVLRPQAVVLKEETTEFYGGQTLARHVNVHNDLTRAAPLRLRWSLTAADGRILAKGQQDLRLAPAELKRVTLNVKLPKVPARTAATWRVELLAVGVPSPQSGVRAAAAVMLFDAVHSEQRDWVLYPAPAVRPPAGLQLSVYDPAGDTARMLTRLGVRFARLDQLAAPAAGALLVGRDALKQAAPGPWTEALAKFVRGGGKVLLLEQGDLPDCLPVPLIQVKDRKATFAFARAGDHPALAGLTDADLRWWAGSGEPGRTADHYVSQGNYRKPVAGNWLPLAEAGTMEGVIETPLVEEYDGRGSWLLCQFLLTDKAGSAPPATALLQNLLDYLAAPAPFRVPGRTALFAGTNAALRAALDASRLVSEDLAGKADQLKPEAFALAVVDAGALDDALAAALGAFAAGGGKVLLHGATPAQQPALEKLLGLRLRFDPVEQEPSDIQNRLLRLGDSGLLAGISNHEFFWGSKKYLEIIRSEGVCWSTYGGIKEYPADERIADWYVQPAGDDAAKAVRLTQPGGLLAVPLGKGVCVLSQLRLDRPHAESEVTAARLRALLLTNLGGTLKSSRSSKGDRDARLAGYEFVPVDLGPFANRALRDGVQPGLKGWSNQGENDMRALPAGRQTLAGVPFVIAGPKAAVVLYSTSGEGNTDLPREITGVPVHRRADALFFLHTAAYASGDLLFSYRVHYADGATADLPVRNGLHALDWWSDPIPYLETLAGNNTVVAFTGDNPMRKNVLVLCHEWINPTPEKEVATVDMVLAPQDLSSPVPIWVGLTAAAKLPSEGVVEDVLGLQGVKVRFGSQAKEVLYIGVAGLEPAHPYYAKALEAHRKLAVGQKVTLAFDAVRVNAAGQTLAYVYLAGQEQDVNGQLNAKVIGEGLGRVGNFEGNTQYRMFFENLGFITQQGKKGLWSAP